MGLLCLQVTNPATGKVLATMPKMKADETMTAIAAAHAVFPKWSNMTAKERSAILRRYEQQDVPQMVIVQSRTGTSLWMLLTV